MFKGAVFFRSRCRTVYWQITSHGSAGRWGDKASLFLCTQNSCHKKIICNLNQTTWNIFQYWFRNFRHVYSAVFKADDVANLNGFLHIAEACSNGAQDTVKSNHLLQKHSVHALLVWRRVFPQCNFCIKVSGQLGKDVSCDLVHHSISWLATSCWRSSLHRRTVLVSHLTGKTNIRKVGKMGTR